MYIRAGGSAYYTTPDKQESIKYVGDDLHIKVAFQNQGQATAFINGLAELNPVFGAPVVEVVTSSRYEHALNLNDAIFEWHFRRNDDTGSPPGSREPVSSTGYVMDRSKKQRIKEYQLLEVRDIETAVAMQMAHIKDKRFCTSSEKKDRNNYFGLSPNCHNMYDGNRRRIPSIIITIHEYDDVHPVRVANTDEGGPEDLYNVMLRVEYFDAEVAPASPIVFKQEALRQQDGLVHLVPVKVVDVTAFRGYVEWKANDTRNKWNPTRAPDGGGDGDEIDDSDEDSAEDD